MSNVNLYLIDYKKETIKNNDFIKLIFAENKSYSIMSMYILRSELNYYLNYINNADPELLRKLKKEVQ